jgi:hypothetical protein
MKHKNTVLIVIISLVLAIIGVKLLIDDRVATANEKSLLALEAKVAEQDLLLSQIADLTRTNGADEITEKIIVDCSAVERARFDTLLDQLSTTISTTEIRELDMLFYKCARFYADRKSVMAARLFREVEVYGEYVRLYGYILGETNQVNDERVLLWKQIADAELKLAQHFNSLVVMQGKIIAALLAGQTKDSTDITNTLSDVSNIRDEMTMLSKQIEDYNAKLRSI